MKISKQLSKLTEVDIIFLIASGTFLLLSTLFSLRLAVPKNQDVNPTALELVEFHRENSVELSRLAFLWFLCWVIGLIAGLVVILS
jgi:hypothetical protein